eukprot:scaffold12.g8008.t1
MAAPTARTAADQGAGDAFEGAIADPSQPGQWFSRSKSMRVVEQAGGAPIIHNPHIEGLVPPVHESMDHQADRVMCQLAAAADSLAQYRILSQIMLTNTACELPKGLGQQEEPEEPEEPDPRGRAVLHLEQLAPIIYTPTVGEACIKFDRIFRPNHNVQIIVVTDGSRILGLGDLGLNGAGISIGKISLYVAGAGFWPEHSLPMVLDVGCNNKELRDEDPYYLGMRKPRLEGEEYYAVVDELCQAVKEIYPNALLQFEDFETSKAFEILHRQRDKLLCFNDDIQGTGAVVTSGFVNGMKTCGISREEARRHIFLVDTKGLVTKHRGDQLPPHKVPFAQASVHGGTGFRCSLGDDVPNMKDLRQIVGWVKPHALIGLSGVGPSWGEDVIQELCKHTPTPLIFPLSNPTSKAEITAEQAYRWSRGACVFAGGSPFDPVRLDGTTYVPGQANNVFIFPGTGFGAVMSKARAVTDEMFVAASQALADCVSEEQLAQKQLYPVLKDLRQVSVKASWIDRIAVVAAAVARAAFAGGVSALPLEPEDWEEYIEGKMWSPLLGVEEPERGEEPCSGSG